MCNGGCSSGGGGHGHAHGSTSHGPNPTFNVSTAPAPLMPVSYLNLSCSSCNAPITYGTQCAPCAKKLPACATVWPYNKTCPPGVNATIIGGVPPGTSVTLGQGW